VDHQQDVPGPPADGGRDLSLRTEDEVEDVAGLLDHGAMPFGMTQYEVKLAEDAGEVVVMPPPPDFGIDRTIRIFEDTPNVHFKITEINFERCVAADVRAARIVRRMVDSFGPHRVMWGSDVGQSMRWTYAEKNRHGVRGR